MKARLMNSSDCCIDKIDCRTKDEAIALMAKHWLPLLDDGDKIVVDEVRDDA